MAFGGYKFYGYHRETPNGGLELAETHAARVLAFYRANEAAGSHWVFDPDKTVSDEVYVLSIDGVQTHCIHTLRDNDTNPLGLATFFKYSHEEVVGYYVILTLKKVSLRKRTESATAGYINFYHDQWCCPTGYNPPNGLKGFCLHAMSLEPFGSLPTDGELSSDFIPTKSIKITPVGSTFPESWTNNVIEATSSNSFQYSSDFYVGYAIKECDVISFATINPVTPAINVLSLNAFSKYYNEGDSNGLLSFPVFARGANSNETSTPSTACCGESGQFLDEVGTNICCNSTRISSGNSNNVWAVIEYSGMSMYDRNFASSKIQVVGSSIGISSSSYGAMVSGSLGKGTVRPEFLSVCLVTPKLTTSALSVGEVFCNGNYLICMYAYQGYTYRINAQGPSSFTDLSVILLCGWDSSNPSIKEMSNWINFDNSWVVEI